MERYDDLLLQMRRDDNRVSGKMRMGILSTGVGTYVMPLVTAFNRRFPNVSFTFMTEKPQHIVQSLMENKLDVGFVAKGDFNDMGLLSYRLIGHDLLKVALPADHPAVARGIVTPEDLAGNTLVCLKIKETTNALDRKSVV